MMIRSVSKTKPGDREQRLAAVVDQLGRRSFDRALLSWLDATVRSDSALILIYPERQRPKILVDALSNPDRRNSAEIYVGAAYLLDPFYLYARRLQEPGLVRLRDIVPEDFAATDYAETYYHRSAVKDEINFLIPIDKMTYAICLERSIRAPAFSTGDLSGLHALLPPIASLVRQHCRLAGLELDADGPDKHHLRLETALANFASGLLTPREREVVGLMLAGHALVQISKKLGISNETARVHRRNIYEKLGISSLAELFASALKELLANQTAG